MVFYSSMKHKPWLHLSMSKAISTFSFQILLLPWGDFVVQTRSTETSGKNYWSSFVVIMNKKNFEENIAQRSDHGERNLRLHVYSVDLAPPGRNKILQTGTHSLLLRTTCVTWHLTIPRTGTMVLTSLMHPITHGGSKLVMTDTYCPFNQNTQAGFKVNIWPLVRRTTEIHHFVLPDITSSLPFLRDTC